ncbi:MAG TPA: VOC family protein [Rhizobiaceae bacterium]|nr:VOC family protein [Rhizobiaceae bacterium]
MTTRHNWPRALDHCVLPTAGLDLAKARLEALGFTVAPMGVHPFGTANHCTYFADGSFLESLSVADRALAERAAAAGNVFVRHHLETLDGRDGFSALVLQTNGAAADHRAFIDAGVSAGDVLEFSRAFIDASGARATATFRLAFAQALEAPGILVFTCERVAVPHVDRAALQRHANGVTCIRSITVVGGDTEALEPVAAVLGTAQSGIAIDATPIDPWNFGAPAFEEASRLAAISFAVEHIEQPKTLLHGAGIDFSLEARRIIVPPAAGQGGTFIFEAD